MFRFGFLNKKHGEQLPSGYLLYLARPNSDGYLVDEGTEWDESIIDWGYELPDDSDFRDAVGWTSGNGWQTIGNPFYFDDGTPRTALATEIADWSLINTGNVLFRMVDADMQTGKLVVYPVDTDDVVLEKACKVLRIYIDEYSDGTLILNPAINLIPTKVLVQ